MSGENKPENQRFPTDQGVVGADAGASNRPVVRIPLYDSDGSAHPAGAGVRRQHVLDRALKLWREQNGVETLRRAVAKKRLPAITLRFRANAFPSWVGARLKNAMAGTQMPLLGADLTIIWMQ